MVQETRLWDEGRLCTYSMRRKEGLADYRYFPEPDLPPLALEQGYLEALRVGAWAGGQGMAGVGVLGLERLGCRTPAGGQERCFDGCPPALVCAA